MIGIGIVIESIVGHKVCGLYCLVLFSHWTKGTVIATFNMERSTCI